MNNSNQIMNDSFMQGKNLIFKKFKLINKIGHGSFGNIYSVKRIIDGKYFALKAEKKKCNKQCFRIRSIFFVHTPRIWHS